MKLLVVLKLKFPLLYIFSYLKSKNDHIITSIITTYNNNKAASKYLL